MLPASSRLRSSREFEETIRAGRRAGAATVVVHAHRTSSDADPRAGLVVSRNVGDAVARNRVKRRFRHLMRPRLASLPPGTRLVLRASAAAASAPSTVLARDLDSCLRRLTRARA